jgi:hypothetical protein
MDRRGFLCAAGGAVVSPSMRRDGCRSGDRITGLHVWDGVDEERRRVAASQQHC